MWCNEDKRVEMISQTSDVKRRLEHLFQHLEEWKANYTRLQVRFLCCRTGRCWLKRASLPCIDPCATVFFSLCSA